MAAISDNLIHFLARSDRESPTKQFSIFKKIIENGLRTSRVQIKFSEGASIINQIICFTDIPLRECNEHTSIYGKFGIGFKKSYVKNAGGNPARYFLDYLPGSTLNEAIVECRGGLYLNMCQQFNFLMQLKNCIEEDDDFELFGADGNLVFPNKKLKEYVQSTIFSLSFEKEMGDLGPARDETMEIDLYYKEREWRLVPSLLNITSCTAKLETSTNNYYYLFKRSDVNMIVVPNEEMRMMVLEYFLSLRTSEDERLKQLGENPLPVINYDDLHRW